MDDVDDDVGKSGEMTGKGHIPVLEIKKSQTQSSVDKESVTQDSVIATKSYPKTQATLGRFRIPTNDPFCTPTKDFYTSTPHISNQKNNIMYKQNWESFNQHSLERFPYCNSVAVTPVDAIGNSKESPIDLSIGIDD